MTLLWSVVPQYWSLMVKAMLKSCMNDAGHSQIHGACVVDDGNNVEKGIPIELANSIFDASFELKKCDDYYNREAPHSLGP